MLTVSTMPSRPRRSMGQANGLRRHRLAKDQWEMKRPVINAYIAVLYDEIQRLEQKIDDLLLEKIQSGSLIGRRTIYG